MNKKPASVSGGKKTKEQRKHETEARDALNRVKKPVLEKISHYESHIEMLESRKQELETQMADPATYEQDGLIKKLQQQHAEIERDLKDCYMDWEALQEELENLIGGNN